MSDYISREALLKRLHEVGGCGAPPDSWADGYDKAIDLACGMVKNAPAADVAPVRYGEWIERAWRPTCSLCGFSGSLIDAPISPFKYCPNCGAKMDGGTP